MKILIAYDGSEASSAALNDLARAGLSEQAEVRLITVADVFLPPTESEAEGEPEPMRPMVHRAHQRAAAEVERARVAAEEEGRRLGSMFPQWNIATEAQADSPAWAIVRVADEWQPDLIVTGAHGDADMGGRFILGSVSQRVLYEAKSSVRIARPPRNTKSSLKIVLGVDNSAGCQAAVETIAGRSWPAGSQIRLVSVLDDGSFPEASASSAVRAWSEVEQDPQQGALCEVFRSAAEKVGKAGLEVSVVLHEGNPKRILIEEADTWQADTIFLGAKGMRGIGRLLLGSVSASVADNATCSVEVVRPATA